MDRSVFIYSVFILLVIAVLTYAARLFPYVVFGRRKEIPPVITYIGEVLPPAVMVVLLVYCVRNTDFLRYPFGIPVAAGFGATFLLYRLTKNYLAAMVCGTVLYMILIRIL
jgi:branched-subunit amino acid transport protein AzlD